MEAQAYRDRLPRLFALAKHRDAIASETLARTLEEGAASTHEADVDGHALAFEITVCDAS